MRIINKLENGIDTKFLERMLEWCRKQIGLPKHWLTEAKYKHLPDRGKSYSSRYGGTSVNAERRIIVSVSRHITYPIEDYGYRHRFGHTYNDIYDLLVSITAHELEHQRQRYKNNFTNEEFNAYKAEYKVFCVFSANKESLLASWTEEDQVILAYGSKVWFEQNAIEYMKEYLDDGGIPDLRVEDFINYCQQLSVLR